MVFHFSIDYRPVSSSTSQWHDQEPLAVPLKQGPFQPKLYYDSVIFEWSRDSEEDQYDVRRVAGGHDRVTATARLRGPSVWAPFYQGALWNHSAAQRTSCNSKLHRHGEDLETQISYTSYKSLDFGTSLYLLAAPLHNNPSFYPIITFWRYGMGKDVFHHHSYSPPTTGDNIL